MEDASAARAEDLLDPIWKLPSTTDLLADALCAKPLCRIPVDQDILDSLSASGRPELKAAFMLRDHSCNIIATAFSYVMGTSLGPVSTSHCCIEAISSCCLQPCLTALIASLHLAPA